MIAGSKTRTEMRTKTDISTDQPVIADTVDLPNMTAPYHRGNVFFFYLHTSHSPGVFRLLISIFLKYVSTTNYRADRTLGSVVVLKFK